MQVEAHITGGFLELQLTRLLPIILERIGTLPCKRRPIAIIATLINIEIVQLIRVFALSPTGCCVLRTFRYIIETILKRQFIRNTEEMNGYPFIIPVSTA